MGFGLSHGYEMLKTKEKVILHDGYNQNEYLIKSNIFKKFQITLIRTARL